MKSKSSLSKKTASPAAKEREAHGPSRMQLQIVELNPTSPMSRSPIKLPHDWVVEERPRVNSAAHPGRVDRYYYEPKSGKQFRSLTAVQKYLCEEMESTLTTQRVKPGNENSMQIVPHVFRSATSLKLPPGWTVEEKPRSNVRYAGVIDRYYIEPGTGQRFRSMRAVERYLAEMEASAAASENSGHRKYISGGDPSLQIVLKYPEDVKRTTTPEPPTTSGSRKKQKTDVEVDPMLDFTCPPAKVKWVLGGPGGSLWNPFMGESMVPEFAQKTWSETFILSIQDKF